MSARTRLRRFRVALLLLAALLPAVSSCGHQPPPRTAFTWLCGPAEPAFDPAGPPDELRWALERLLSQSLVAVNDSGRVVPAAAQTWELSPDKCTYTFHLRPGLQFRDGHRCTSADFARSLRAGLNRVDHATYSWLFRSISGMDRARAGRPLPGKLGILARDEATLIIRLDRPEPTLLERLALPGATAPWAADSDWAGGTGPYRLAAREAGRRMVLVRSGAYDGPDTIKVEFGQRASIALTRMRQGRGDLVWPLPPGLLSLPRPENYVTRTRAAEPARRLWLIMRADLPPTRKPEARRALAHAFDRGRVRSALAAYEVQIGGGLTGGDPVELPSRDPAMVREWFDRGKLGRAMHVVMAYRGDGIGAEVAQAMQSAWAEQRIDVELRPLRGAAFSAEALGRGGAQLLLLEAQAPLADPACELAMLVAPRRGPPVGSFRTGWITNDFERWLGSPPQEPEIDVNFATERLGEELIALPLLEVPWCWIERSQAQRIRFDPHFGPGPGPEPVALPKP
jgi:MarR-like DNA-binding transcriptional regulator SgrR of sgrS sRNA